MNRADAKHRILLVDADRTDGPAALAMLTRAGYAVDETTDGLCAVQAAAAQPYDLILMDLHPSGLDGLEATRRIRRLPHPRGDVPILALSPGSGAEDKDLCLAAGADGLLAQPVSQVGLLEAVAHWVESAEDPAWGLEMRPGVAPPLINRCTLGQLEEDVGAELLPEILATFLVETERRLGLLAARAGAGDADGAAHEAHALKGGSGTFGAMALRQAAFEMEQAGRAGDRERIDLLLPGLQRLARETCALLRTLFPGLVQ